MVIRIPDYDITKHNTFGMTVKCNDWIEYDSIHDLPSIASEIKDKKWMHIGGGSNLLFTGDYDGYILHSRIAGIEVEMLDDRKVRVSVGAGLKFDDLIDWACTRNLWGIENLSDIPGEAGAAAVQNIGAYGVEVKDVIESVECYDVMTNAFREFENEECAYGYRDSMFKRLENRKRYIVTGLKMILRYDGTANLDYGNLKSEVADNPTPSDVRNAVGRIRASKLPAVESVGSAGSFFKNPIVSRELYESISQDCNVPHYDVEGGVKIPAAWLIEQCGWKGSAHGGAAVWHKQPLIIVNSDGHATPNDVIELENKIIDSVRLRFGIELHPEVDHVK